MLVEDKMLFGAETRATMKGQEAWLDVNQMRMLRWMRGLTKKDMFRNEHTRGTTKVLQGSKKISEKRLKWYGYVMRREEEHIK